MKKDLVILLAEDNEGQAFLVKLNLTKAGIHNKLLHFWHGGEVLDFLYRKGTGPFREEDTPYLLLLDIRMPVVDGNQVLKQIKEDTNLRTMPIIMLTTTDDPEEIQFCHTLGCNAYIIKPVDSKKFIETIRTLGLFLMIIEVPNI
jgi:CheY-like chemotaxis protein